jgi:hypothetical protein
MPDDLSGKQMASPRVVLGMALPRRLGCGAMWLSSHASDGATEATWSQRDVNTESC